MQALIRVVPATILMVILAVAGCTETQQTTMKGGMVAPWEAWPLAR